MVSNFDTWRDTLVYWDVSDSHNACVYCGIAAFSDEDIAYIGRIDNIRSTDLTPEDIEAALCEVPDEEIYPKLDGRITGVASEDPGIDIFIKRPSLQDYYFFKGEDGRGLSQLRDLLLDEARAFEIISREPHPNIVHYRGCRVKRGYITGIILNKISGHSLWRLLEYGLGRIDLEPFMEALTSAVNHLHKLGLSHNDICPQNVMVSNGNPVLIDFGSCRRTGDKMAASGGSTGWKEDGDEYLLSKNSHDLVGLAKIRQWILKKYSSGT